MNGRALSWFELADNPTSPLRWSSRRCSFFLPPLPARRGREMLECDNNRQENLLYHLLHGFTMVRLNPGCFWVVEEERGCSLIKWSQFGKDLIAHLCDQSIDLIWGTLGSLFSKICFQFFLQTTRFFPFSPPNKKNYQCTFLIFLFSIVQLFHFYVRLCFGERKNAKRFIINALKK